MSINRSKRYNEIHDETWDQYRTPPADVRDSGWWKKIAPKWRNRVGMPRLVAENALFEASGVVRSINRGLFRSDPETDERFVALCNELQEFAADFARENWNRFEGIHGRVDTTNREVGTADV
jgi:hypothetical protein